jgi:hypothetical protein
MVLIKGEDEGNMPSTEMLEAMGKYNEELVNAGVMLAGDGLQPSSKGARVRFEGGKTSVTDGPFAETKELLAGYWVLEVKSMDEAIEWVKRIPADPNEAPSEVEVRPLFEVEDFGDELTPELREQDQRLRSKIEEQQD